MMRASYSLSSGQQVLWFLNKIGPESIAYNIFITTKINLSLNFTKLKGTLHLLKLDDQLIQQLKYFAINSGKTLDQILLTAFYVQLYRYIN